MAKHPHLWRSLTQYYKKDTSLLKIPPHKKSTQNEWHLTKMASHKNDILQKWHLKTYIIGFLRYYQHPASKNYTHN